MVEFSSFFTASGVVVARLQTDLIHCIKNKHCSDIHFNADNSGK